MIGFTTGIVSVAWSCENQPAGHLIRRSKLYHSAVCGLDPVHGLIRSTGHHSAAEHSAVHNVDFYPVLELNQNGCINSLQKSQARLSVQSSRVCADVAQFGRGDGVLGRHLHQPPERLSQTVHHGPNLDAGQSSRYDNQPNELAAGIYLGVAVTDAPQGELHQLIGGWVSQREEGAHVCEQWFLRCRRRP